MKALIIVILGLIIFGVGLLNIQNSFIGYTCCFLGGSLIGVGLSESIK